MVLWLWNERGAHRIEDPRFLPTFYLHAAPAELPEIRRRTEILDGVREVREVSRRIALEDDEAKSVLEIVPRHYRDIRELAHILDSNGGYIDHRLYNVDLRFSQRYAMDHGLFPMGLVRYGNGIWTPEEEHFALEYPLPPLKRALLDLHVDNPAGIPRMQDKLLGARIDDVELDGSQESILRGIEDLVASKDPDILMTDGGDAFVMPYLARKAAELGVEMRLGRDPDKFAERKGKSYFTYGKIVFKPGQYILRGRLHLDRGHFAMRESDFAGLAELSRLSTLTPQEQARLTPGTAFTAMQTNLAYQDGCLVVWKKNRPEDFKDAENLLRGDRGGFTFEPEVGVHEGLYELDFSSLYPSIMVKYNISAETLDCACCPTDGLPVPELRYHMCTRRVGIVGRVLKPLIERRRYYKKMKKELGPLQDVYTGRDTILKWTLVTCYDGNTLVPIKENGIAKIKRIADVVDPHLPDRPGIASVPKDLRAVGFDNRMRLVEKPIRKLIKSLAPKTLLQISLQGGRNLLVTPNHRFFVSTASGLTRKRADALRIGHKIPVATEWKVDGNEPPVSLNAARVLLRNLSKKDLEFWRVRGPGLKKHIRSGFRLLYRHATNAAYIERSVHIWRQTGQLPLRFLPLLTLRPKEWNGLEVGHGRRNGGRIPFLRARISVDADLAFLVGFYIGDGSGTGNMIRLYVGMDESEIVAKLMSIVRRKFGIEGVARKEKHARMWVVQFNSGVLKRIFRDVLHVGESTDKEKLVVPDWILNASEDVRKGFVSGLIASDGAIHPKGKAVISSASREFLEKVRLLLGSLGIPSQLYSSRPHTHPIHSLYLPAIFLTGIWLKNGHKARVKLLRCPRILPSQSDVSFVSVKKIEKVAPTGPYVYCFEVTGPPNGFLVQGMVYASNSFGYQGYKNARFGRIECHEAINAYARDILVHTMEIAESHGYEVVHGIVDSVWLRPKPNADPIEKVREHIAGSIGLPIELEGRYKWIVFLPCKTTGVGALNRYYGLFQDDEFKLRGIELRKHDTPEFINICQEAMLGELSLASTAAEFRERIPKAVDILRWTAKCVLDRAIPVHQFILTKSVSRALPEYVVLTATAAALKQMEKRGFPVEPGESVRYVLMDARARDSERKVRVAEFLQGDETPDAWEYIKLLCRSGQTLLAPFGYTEDKLFAMCEDLSDLSITNMPERAIAIQEDYKSAGESRSKARGGVGYKKPWRVIDEASTEEAPPEL